MSWPVAALGEVVDFKRFTVAADDIDDGSNYVGLEHIEGTGDFVNVGRVAEGELGSSKFRFTSRQILFGKLRPYLRKVARPDFDGVCSTDILPLTPTSALDRDYLFHALRRQEFIDLASARASGANLPRIAPGVLAEMQIPVPPLPEQRRIAAILDKAYALRAKRREAIAKLDQLLQSVFLDMFGDPVTNPKGWHAQKSASLFRDKPRIGTTRPATGSGIVVVRVGEIGGDEIDFQRCSRAELEQDEVERYSLAPGDTVIARAIGSKEQLGKCSYFAGSSESVCIDSHVMRLRPDPERCDPLWFNFLLRSPGGKRLLQSKGGATAVQFNINTTQVSDLDVPLPPIELQRRFSNAFARVRVQKQVHSESERGFDDMFRAVQQQAFSGNL